MVVDDDDLFRETVVQFLENNGYRTVEAEYGARAVQYCRENTPALILMDAKMPGMDGVAACAEISRQSRPESIPVIMVTAMDSAKEVDRAYGAGAEDYLTKPIHWPVLKQRIRKTLERRLLDRALRTANAGMENQVIRRTGELRRANENLRIQQVRLEIQNADLRRAHLELEKARDHWSSLFQSAPLGFVLLSAGGDIEEINVAGSGLLGAGPESLIGQPFSRFFDPGGLEGLSGHLRELFRGGRPQSCEVDGLREGETGKTLELTSVPLLVADGSPPRFLVAINDITAIKRSRAELAMSESRFRGAFETAAHGMALISPRGRFLQVNRALCDIVGYRETELLDRDFQTITHPGDLEVCLNKVKEMLAGTIHTYQIEKRCLHRNGQQVWVFLSASLVRDGSGEPLHFVSQVQDITEKKRVFQELGRQRLFLETILENIEDGIVACNSEGILTVFNRATRVMHGLDEQPLPPERWSEVYDLYRADGVTPLPMAEIPLFRALQGREVHHQEMVIAPKSGKKRLVQVSGRSMVDSRGERLGAVVTMHDITRERRERETLNRFKEEVEKRERERLSHALHDTAVQNLHVALLALKTLRQRLRSGAVLAADALDRAVDGITGTVQQLRDISAEIHPAFLEKMDLDEAMHWKCEQMNRLCGIRIQCEDDQLWERMSPVVKRNTFMIFQEALVNAVKHASGEDVNVRLAKKGDHTFIMEISDRGQGFDPQRTRAKSRGLGLSIMKERAVRIGGQLQIDSSPGNGTTIQLQAPLTS